MACHRGAADLELTNQPPVLLYQPYYATLPSLLCYSTKQPSYATLAFYDGLPCCHHARLTCPLSRELVMRKQMHHVPPCASAVAPCTTTNMILLLSLPYRRAVLLLSFLPQNISSEQPLSSLSSSMLETLKHAIANIPRCNNLQCPVHSIPPI